MTDRLVLEAKVAELLAEQARLREQLGLARHRVARSERMGWEAYKVQQGLINAAEAERDLARGEVAALVNAADALSLSTGTGVVGVLGIPQNDLVVVNREKMQALQIALRDTQAAALAHDTAVAQRVREHCAAACDYFAEMMEAGAGEDGPGHRLRQVARLMRENDLDYTTAAIRTRDAGGRDG